MYLAIFRISSGDSTHGTTAGALMVRFKCGAPNSTGSIHFEYLANINHV